MLQLCKSCSGLYNSLTWSHHLKQLLQDTGTCYSTQLLPFLPSSLSQDATGAVWHQLVFTALISILYLVQILLRISTRASSSCSSSGRTSMPTTNRKMVIFLPPMLTFPSCFSRALDMILSRKMLKSVGDSRHPCLTPTVVLNHSRMLNHSYGLHLQPCHRAAK